MTPAIRLQDVTIAYDRQPAVHHVSGVFGAGELVAIAGPNGAGKSTLLKALAGMLSIHEGTIHWQQTAQQERAYMPQSAAIERDFPLNVVQMVTQGFWRQTGGSGRITATHRARAVEALAAVGLRGFERRSLASLSAGQFQRVLFARVMVQDAPVILLDEPFTAMDAGTTQALLAVMQQWHREGRTVICVLHDMEQIRNYFTQCVLLARQVIAWGTPQEVLKPEHLIRARVFREAYPTIVQQEAVE